MNAEPLLNVITRTFAEHRLEAIMVGNAAAALHGALVTTLDINFMFRKTLVNLKKLKAVAASLRAVILKPYYPVSDLFRLISDEQGLQLDFMSRLHGLNYYRLEAGRFKDFVSYGLKSFAHEGVTKTRWSPSPDTIPT